MFILIGSMKNLLLYAVYGRYRTLSKVNSEIFRSKYKSFTSKLSSVLPIGTRNEKCFTRQPPVANLKCLGVRCYSKDTNSNKLKLMEFEWILWPSIFKTIKNWIFSSLIIRPYFDPDFDLPEFVTGSKHAVEVVSAKLSTGDYESLEGLVTRDCLTELQKNISTLSLTQRQELAINHHDIYFTFPYEVGVMFDEAEGNDSKQKRSVEITMVYHVLRGYKELMDKGVSIPLNMGVLPEYRDKIFVCNYRFVREYTKGVTDQWTINIVNHHKPSEHTE